MFFFELIIKLKILLGFRIETKSFIVYIKFIFMVPLLKYNYHYIQDQFTINLYFRSHKREYEKTATICICVNGAGIL